MRRNNVDALAPCRSMPPRYWSQLIKSFAVAPEPYSTSSRSASCPRISLDVFASPNGAASPDDQRRQDRKDVFTEKPAQCVGQLRAKCPQSTRPPPSPVEPTRAAQDCLNCKPRDNH